MINYYKLIIFKVNTTQANWFPNFLFKQVHKHLTDFHEEINDNNEYSINGDYLQEEKDIINKKFDEFKNNNMVQEKVQHFLTNIYNSKKEDSLKIFKELVDEQEKDLIEG